MFSYPTGSLQLQRHCDSPSPDASCSATSGSKNPAFSQRNVSVVNAETSFSIFFWDEFYCRRCPRHSATRAQPTQGEKHLSPPRSVSVPFFDVIPKVGWATFEYNSFLVVNHSLRNVFRDAEFNTRSFSCPAAP